METFMDFRIWHPAEMGETLPQIPHLRTAPRGNELSLDLFDPMELLHPNRPAEHNMGFFSMVDVDDEKALAYLRNTLRIRRERLERLLDEQLRRNGVLVTHANVGRKMKVGRKNELFNLGQIIALESGVVHVSPNNNGAVSVVTPIERPRIFGRQELQGACELDRRVKDLDISTHQFAVTPDPEGRGAWVGNLSITGDTHIVDVDKPFGASLPSWLLKICQSAGISIGRPPETRYNTGEPIH